MERCLQAAVGAHAGCRMAALGAAAAVLSNAPGCHVRTVTPLELGLLHSTGGSCSGEV